MIGAIDLLETKKVKQEAQKILAEAKRIEETHQNNMSPEDYAKILDLRRRTQEFLNSLEQFN